MQTSVFLPNQSKPRSPFRPSFLTLLYDAVRLVMYVFMACNSSLVADLKKYPNKDVLWFDVDCLPAFHFTSRPGRDYTSHLGF